MKIGKVIGRTTLSVRDSALPAGALIIVPPIEKAYISNPEKAPISKKLSNLVVFDALGATEGDIVSYVEGAEATAPFESPVPVDAYNVGIVEKVNLK